MFCVPACGESSRSRNFAISSFAVEINMSDNLVGFKLDASSLLCLSFEVDTSKSSLTE